MANIILFLILNYRFPANVELKKQWMEAVGVTTVSKAATVCSDHFHNDSFHQTDGYTFLRRLTSTAVPLNQNDQSSPLLSSPINNASTQVLGDIIKNQNDQSSPLLSSPINNVSTQILGDIITHQDMTNAENKSFPTSTNTGFETHDHLSSRNSIKRKSSAVDVFPKKYRFMIGYQSESFSKEDFNSNKAWNRFARVMTHQKRKRSASHMNLVRKEKKINDMKELIKNMKEKQFFESAEYLQVNL
ncbi:PREDICTED: uncharacterized protein LOC105460702 isoform X1 [Wasmannia auropunctata]|uniref:uncharacterized protein LOC105460702 isoform X1 n=1 Tax=Wasmannia auropunctata TaxID=64793 RepID=UPI0005EDF984|nr:PREDICTED: uncharacterized protein LOC105460702 isoform X1 [Wasmannia auropunctata]